MNGYDQSDTNYSSKDSFPGPSTGENTTIQSLSSTDLRCYWLRYPWIESIITSGLLFHGRYYIRITEKASQFSASKPNDTIPGNISLTQENSNTFTICHDLKCFNPILQLLEVLL